MNIFSKRVCILVVIFQITLGLYSEEITKENLLETGLPLMEIETIGGELPTCDFISHPEGAMGEGITNRTVVCGSLLLLQGEETLYDSGSYEEGVSGMTLRLRGNTSAYVEKKPYKIKLQKKADLLGRGDEYADKEWLLIKDELSFTNDNEMSLKPIIGFKVNELLGLQWTPSGRYVNVMINKDYKGIYYLVESVKRNKSCRIKIDKDTGYLIEYDPYWWNEPVYFDTNKTSTSLSFKFTFKEPDVDDLTEEKIEYIRSYMNEVEASIADGTFAEKIDVASFVNWILAADILGTDDGGGSNVFLTKYDNSSESKIMMANLWDFDGIMKNEGEWPGNHNILYFRQLREHDEFNEAYYERWKSISTSFLQEMNHFFDDYTKSPDAIALDKARIFEKSVWNSEYFTVENNLESARNWFSARVNWLNTKLGITTSIRERLEDTHNNEDIFYNLNGQKVKTLSPGVYIKNGRKYIK